MVVAPTVAYMDVRRSLLRLQDAGRAEVRFVDITDTDAVIAACDGANVLWLESPTNPLLGIADLPCLCAAARERGMLCVVDNTFATPLLQRPLELGADVVVHSATKAMGGHSDLLLGAVVAADETHFAALREARELGGATPGALEAFLCLRGLRTLPLRLERAQHNAGVLAERLADHPEVSRCATRAWPPTRSISAAATRSPAPGSCSPSACAAAPHAPMRSSRPSPSSRMPPASGASRRRSSAAPAIPPSAASSPTICCASASAANTSRTCGQTSSRRSRAPPPQTTATVRHAGRDCAMSKMREAMISQPDELARLLADDAPAEKAADRLAGAALLLVGIGTSWHAAHHGAWLLREAGSRPRRCMPPTSPPTAEP